MSKLVVGFVAVACAVTLSAFGQNKVVFDNQSGDPALVKLIGPTKTEVQVANGAKAGVDAAAGKYTIKVRYGTPGSYRYSKGQEFEVTETTTARSETTITLHKVVAGNYESQPISETEFGGTSSPATTTLPRPSTGIPAGQSAKSPRPEKPDSGGTNTTTLTNARFARNDKIMSFDKGTLRYENTAFLPFALIHYLPSIYNREDSYGSYPDDLVDLKFWDSCLPTDAWLITDMPNKKKWIETTSGATFDVVRTVPSEPNEMTIGAVGGVTSNTLTISEYVTFRSGDTDYLLGFDGYGARYSGSIKVCAIGVASIKDLEKAVNWGTQAPCITYLRANNLWYAVEKSQRVLFENSYRIRPEGGWRLRAWDRKTGQQFKVTHDRNTISNVADNVRSEVALENSGTETKVPIDIHYVDEMWESDGGMLIFYVRNYEIAVLKRLPALNELPGTRYELIYYVSPDESVVLRYVNGRVVGENRKGEQVGILGSAIFLGR